MYLKITSIPTDRENFYEAEILEVRQSHAKVKYRETTDDYSVFWMPLPGEGKLSGTWFEYELIEELPLSAGLIL
jgi:hypothetical protein